MKRFLTDKDQGQAPSSAGPPGGGKGGKENKDKVCSLQVSTTH